MGNGRLQNELAETSPDASARTEFEALIRRLEARARTYSDETPSNVEPSHKKPYYEKASYDMCVSAFPDNADGTPAAPPGDEVLFDLVVAGQRYLLVRLQPRPPRLHEILSPREQEIARMIAKGHPNKTIAAVLDISTFTVDTYLRRIFMKLNVCSRAAMVARLMEESAMPSPHERGL